MTVGNLPEAVRRVDVRTLAEWLAVGVSRRKLQALVRAGELVRVRYGVYATARAMRETRHDPRFRHAVQVAAARAATGRDSVASHRSAALMHGIALLGKTPPDQVTLTRPRGADKERFQRTGIVLHAADLPGSHVTSYRGVPVTTAARTVADLARSGSFMSGVVSADNALYREKTTNAQIGDVLAGCGRWPGVEQARRVLEFADELAESPLESCARVVFAQRDLPPPALQVDLGGDTYIGRVDFYWQRYYTVAEADGDLKYDGRAEALAQLERDQRLRAAGLRVVHFTWYQLFGEQDMVINWIQRAFAGRIG